MTIPERIKEPTVPLTDNEVINLMRMWLPYQPASQDVFDFARAIEAAHGIAAPTPKEQDK